MLKKLLVASIAFTALIAGSATAADLARPVYRRPVVVAPPPVSSWSGIYVGLEGGYGWGKQSTDAISPGDQFSPVIINGSGTSTLQPPLLFFPDVAVPSINQKGWLFGGFFGAQKQWGNWVLGIEGDIDGANIKESVTSNATSFSSNRVTFAGGGGGFGIPCVSGPCFTLNHNVSIDSKIDVLASLRGKVGWSFAPNWLIYGTGGAAFAHVENTVISTETNTAAPELTTACQAVTCVFPNFSLNTSGGTTIFGWALGGGVDWKLQLDAGSASVFGVEYLHYGFPDETITLTNNAEEPSPSELKRA